MLVEKTREIIKQREEGISQISELMALAREKGVTIRYLTANRLVLTVTAEKVGYPAFWGIRRLSLERIQRFPFPTHAFWKNYQRTISQQPKIEIVSSQ